jgi:hypothetical protein
VCVLLLIALDALLFFNYILKERTDSLKSYHGWRQNDQVIGEDGVHARHTECSP